MFARREKAAQHENLVVRVHVALGATHHLDELRREFERRSLEPEVPAGTRRENEAEVDMNDVPLVVDQNVPVVPMRQMEALQRACNCTAYVLYRTGLVVLTV